jgi:hypothetical protein
MERKGKQGISRRDFFKGPAAGIALALALVSPLAADNAQAESSCVPGPGDRPETGVHGGVPGFERQAPLGFQGFWCGARKVGQHALYNRGSFGDVQLIADDRGHCAYASMRDPSNLDAPTTGTVVLDVSVASKPVDVQILRTPAMLRAYSGFETPISKATRRPGNTMVAARQNSDQFDVYDVSGDCLQPSFLATTVTAEHNHDGWLTPDGKTYYGVPFGSQDNPEHPGGGQTGIRDNPNRIDMHVMDVSNRSNPVHLANWNRRSLPADIFDRTSFTTNFHDVSTNDEGTRVYMGLYGGGSADLAPIDACANGLLILDSSDVALRRPNPELRFVSWTSWCDQQIDSDFGDGRTASAHTTEYVAHENGKEYILTTDEGSALGGSADGMCSQRTYSRFIDISDERNPRVVSTFKPDVNKPENCQQNIATDTTGGMVHYVGFDDRYNMRLMVYAASNQGMRFVDFRDPENPKEIAYYVKERHVAANAAPAQLFPNFTTGSTSVTGTDFTRPDPRYDPENCFWYTGWNQGGLVSIELTNPEYNACMRRKASGGGWLAGAGAPRNNKIEFDFNAERKNRGFGALKGKLKLKDKRAKVDIRVAELSSLGSMRDECGAVSARANTVQFEGSGTYNGQAASFRVCVRDNGEARSRGRNTGKGDDFFLACTEGCSYSVGGKLGGGNIQVKQRPEKPARRDDDDDDDDDA